MISWIRTGLLSVSASGETLLLNTEAAAVLELLANGMADEAVVVASATGGRRRHRRVAEVNEALRHVWDQLGSAGLIESVVESEHNPG